MPVVRIESSEGATEWAKELCHDQVSLDSLQAAYMLVLQELHQAREDLANLPAAGEPANAPDLPPAVYGEMTDLTWVNMECRRICKLTHVEGEL